MKIKLVSDASSFIPLDFAKENNIGLLESIIMINDKGHREISELNREEFMDSLKFFDPYPTTAQASIQDALDVFTKAKEENYREILYIGISPNISSQMNSARLAAKRLQKEIKITIYSSDLSCASEGIMVYNAWKMIEKGKTVEEIVTYLDSIKEKIYTIGVSPDFFTLFRTGRVKKSVAMNLIASSMNLKPIAEVNTQDGVIGVGAGLGYNSALKKMVKKHEEHTDEDVVYDLIMADTFNPELSKKYENELKKIRKIKNVYKWDISPVVGMTTGKGCVMATLAPAFED